MKSRSPRPTQPSAQSPDTPRLGESIVNKAASASTDLAGPVAPVAATPSDDLIAAFAPRADGAVGVKDYGHESKVDAPRFRPIPLETQTIYAELMDHLEAADMVRSFGDLDGNIVSRDRDGADHWYFRTSEGGQGRQEFYIGPDNEPTRLLIRNYEQQRAASAATHERTVRLSSMLRTSGIEVVDLTTEKIIQGMASAGMFRLGGVLVGTHAFVAIGNALGVRWTSGVHTQDVDFATPRTIAIGLPQSPVTSADIPAAIEALGMGFIPHVRLHSASKATTYLVRGTSTRIDFVTSPQGGDRESPVRMPRFNAYAQPLEFMSYLMEKSFHGSVINRGATLVNLPEPARFAIHKLLVASNRAARHATKIIKDRQQAFDLLSYLQQERPGDIELAVEDLVSRGESWRQRVVAQATKMPGTIHGLDNLLNH